ncbi:hypothetical protein G6011_01886 [Alternaria panax]|uniref:MYND-type domain-containing protein n=1 Tax=Alternaria panax TaxID=48097 RepID=A0AAD4I6U1_9PLEO|nr:hypothetical protein G6011_01886 [Alternaria panax]
MKFFLKPCIALIVLFFSFPYIFRLLASFIIVSNTAPKQCASCKKTAADIGLPNLQQRSKCRTTEYCGRDCQKADWKAHKKICAQQANTNAYAGFPPSTTHSTNYSAPRMKTLEKHVPNPFTRLDDGNYLHDRPEKDVYRLLIDAFRMRKVMHLMESAGPGEGNIMSMMDIGQMMGVLEFSSSSNGTQQSFWNKQPKTSAVPDILNDPKIRGRLSRQDVSLSTVLANSYEKCKDRFARHKKGKTQDPVQTSHDIFPSQEAASPQPNLTVITQTRNSIDSPPQPPQKSGSVPGRRDSRPEVNEHARAIRDDVSIDLISKIGLPTITPNTGNTKKGSDKAAPFSRRSCDEEVEDDEWSTPSRMSQSRSLGLRTSACTSPLEFHKILSQHVGGSVVTAEDDYQYCKQFKGGDNYVRIYNVLTATNAGAYVVKVPGVGTALRWQKHDGYMLRSEFGTIKFIRERTKCPVPEVIAYSDTLDKDLDVSYILMKACTGVSGVGVWFGANADGTWDPEEADFPSAALAAKRLRMLRSLAQTMAELRNLEFDKIGALKSNNADKNGMPTVGPVRVWETNPYCMTDMFTEKAPREYLV